MPFLVCDVPSWSWGGWLRTQDTLVQFRDVQRLKQMILQGDALLALLEIGLRQIFFYNSMDFRQLFSDGQRLVSTP